jgi:pyrimidine deaminase RibD-like protein
MRLFEFELVDMNKLDDRLAELCSMIKKGQQERPEYYGMVAAGIVTPKGKFVAKLNYAKGSKRVHAERAAIEEYTKYHGMIPEGSIMVTTLSPCNETDDDTAEGRVGMSCTDLINHHGFKHVYCGYKDPTQDADHGEYKEVITKNKQLRNMCKQFADTFLDELNEFAVSDNGDDDEEQTLHKLARMWYKGDEHTQQHVEKILARMGWEIGEIESEEGGCFVVQSGDEHGRSYIGFDPEDLMENFADGRNPQDKGDSKRYHVPTKSSVSSLRKFAKGHSGRAAQLAHWMANMKSGHKK